MPPNTFVSGEAVRKLDERFRISLPQSMVDAMLGDSSDVVLVKESLGAISVWSADEWLQRNRVDVDLLQSKWKAGRLDVRRADLQRLGRLMSTRHRQMTLAGRSRLLLPEGYREFLDVEPGGEVVILGAAVCIELWRPTAWQQHLYEAIGGYQPLMDELTA